MLITFLLEHSKKVESLQKKFWAFSPEAYKIEQKI